MSYKDDDLIQLRKITLYGDVNKSNTGELINQLIYLDSKSDKDIEFIINSNGGDTTATFALIDIIQSLKSNVNTIGLGVIASSGLLLFMAGNKRTLTKNTSVLSHRYSWRSIGKHQELVADRKEQDLTHTRMLNYYKEITGLDEKELESYLLKESDTWLTPKEAIDHNLATNIYEGKK
jgi:ATP-dependent Clp protease protease subunit